MATQTQVQNTLLSAEYLAATLTNANLAKMQVGNTDVSWDEVRKLTRNIQALQIQFNLQSYTDWTLYDCLNSLIGFDTTVNSIDPNYQIPNSEIVVVNPAGYISPIDFSWENFSLDGSPDGGVTRVTYYNANWAGVNPFMSLDSPAMTSLKLGVDYSLIPAGGIIILPGSTVLPGIGDGAGIIEGQTIRAGSYALA